MNRQRVQEEALDQFRLMAQRSVDAYVLFGEGAVQGGKRIQYQHHRNGRHW